MQRARTSSRLKRTPPIGAPKATLTPAAAAADSICNDTTNDASLNELNNTCRNRKMYTICAGMFIVISINTIINEVIIVIIIIIIVVIFINNIEK